MEALRTLSTPFSGFRELAPRAPTSTSSFNSLFGIPRLLHPAPLPPAQLSTPFSGFGVEARSPPRGDRGAFQLPFRDSEYLIPDDVRIAFNSLFGILGLDHNRLR